MLSRIEIDTNSTTTLEETSQDLRYFEKNRNSGDSEEYEDGFEYACQVFGSLINTRVRELVISLSKTFSVGELVTFETGNMFAELWKNRTFEVEVESIDEEGYLNITTEWGQTIISPENVTEKQKDPPGQIMKMQPFQKFENYWEAQSICINKDCDELIDMGYPSKMKSRKCQKCGTLQKVKNDF